MSVQPSRWMPVAFVVRTDSGDRLLETSTDVGYVKRVVSSVWPTGAISSFIVTKQKP